jgi:hypothetical protein
MKTTIYPIFHALSGLFNNRKTEFIVFSSLVLLNSGYLFLYRFVPSLDGPQHLYNSRVIIELLKSNEAISQFFKFNQILVGYWTAHALLAFFNWIFPAWVAEKMFLFVCLTGVAFSFRYLVKSINGSVSYAALLIIPISQHSFFFMGYYAFSLAWIFFFLILGYYLKHHEKLDFRKGALLGSLLILGFLTHLIIYVFTLSLIGLHVIYITITQQKRDKLSHIIGHQFKKAVVLLMVALPSLILAIRYYFHVAEITPDYPETEESVQKSFEMLYRLSCLVGFNHSTEGFYNRLLFQLIIALTAFIVGGMIIRFFRASSSLDDSVLFRGRFFWLAGSLIFLLLYFLMPGTYVTGGLSLRLLMLFLVIVVIFLAVHIVQWYLQVVILGFVIFYGIGMFQIRSEYYKQLDAQIRNLELVTSGMEENSIFVTVNAYPVWNNSHFHLYAGMDKPLVSPQNPQCSGQFPIVWNKEKIPTVFLGSYSANQMRIYWMSGGLQENNIHFIDYIIVQGYIAFRDLPEHKETREKVEKYYRLAELCNNKYWALYKYKLNEIVKEKTGIMKSDPGYDDLIREWAIREKISVENAGFGEAVQKEKTLPGEEFRFERK